MPIGIINNNNKNIFYVLFDKIYNYDEFKWYIIFIDGVTNDSGISYQEITTKVQENEFGYLTNKKYLISIINSFDYLYDLFLIGKKSDLNIPKNSDEAQFYEFYDFVIELGDSTFWKVFASDTSYFEDINKIIVLDEYY